MRKLVLASAMALGSFASFATTPVIFHDGIAEEIYADQDEYTPIDATELPTAITDALEADFPGIEVSKAFKNDADEYKIQVEVGGQTSNLYATADGEWIQK
ncbi:hypothetical protein HX109_07355 [Galbibacter sp. BG1]|uniref:hypothetical protein n=1 Tax=Galbibacter sp. BG1 TaxID=1170699 RepID=UPI0015B86477|nr:hypothetical protein [Galbibacter sp. BG1]QLE01388.1 hypothetical protein HX109_07355 [Galbibacter sp. BG1]